MEFVHMLNRRTGGGFFLPVAVVEFAMSRPYSSVQPTCLHGGHEHGQSQCVHGEAVLSDSPSLQDDESVHARMHVGHAHGYALVHVRDIANLEGDLFAALRQARMVVMQRDAPPSSEVQ
jgi:hypothetical protein